MSKNQTRETNVETTSNAHSQEDNTSLSEDEFGAKRVYNAAQRRETGLCQRVLGKIREHNMRAKGREGITQIPEEAIDFAPIPTVRRDADNRPYVEDVNHIVRYYLDVSEVTMTDDFCDKAQTVDSNERTNSFETVYNLA